MFLSCAKFSTLFALFYAVSRRANLRLSLLVRSLKFILPSYFAACLMLAVPIRAQQPPATVEPAVLHATIKDAMGAVIPNALVVITNAATSNNLTVRSDQAGMVEALGLPPGTYSIRIQAVGFKTKVRDGVILAAGKISALDLRLEVAASGGVQVDAPKAPNSFADGRGTWELGAFLGGGTGAGKSSNTQFLFAGGRGGLVLTPDLASNTPLRGNFEYAVEVMPVYTVFTPNGAVYGASIKPFVFRWNFTANQRVVPYLHIAGGVLFTTSDVPPPNTSSINFTTQIGGGIHYFVRPDRSFDFGVDVVHHSNASLGDHNPGYNASVFFSVGYSWYKHRR
jgi:hypothetical protein